MWEIGVRVPAGACRLSFKASAAIRTPTRPGGKGSSNLPVGDAPKGAFLDIAYKVMCPRFAGIAQSVEPPPCKQGDARSKRGCRLHFCRNSSVAEHLLGMQATGVRSSVSAPCIGSPTGRDTGLRSPVLGVRITPDAPIRCRSLIGKGRPLKKGSMRVRILPTAPSPWSQDPKSRSPAQYKKSPNHGNANSQISPTLGIKPI